MPRHERVVLDTVTISNFIKVSRLDLICELYIDNLYVTEAVIIELGRANDDRERLLVQRRYSILSGGNNERTS